MKSFLFLSLTVLSGLLIAACDNDNNPRNGVGPQYADITFTPNPCNVGDTITATLSYSSKGSNWYAATFKWTATTTDSTYNGQSTRVPDPLKYGSTFQMKAPQYAATYNVTVRADYQYTTSGPQGQLYGQSNSVSGQLVVREKNIAN